MLIGVVVGVPVLMPTVGNVVGAASFTVPAGDGITEGIVEDGTVVLAEKDGTNESFTVPSGDHEGIVEDGTVVRGY